MGSCFSKKTRAASPPPPFLNNPNVQIGSTKAEEAAAIKNPSTTPDGEAGKKAEERTKKEVFLIKHPRIHDAVDQSGQDSPVSSETGETGKNLSPGSGSSAPMNGGSSSRTKEEEVDAILIQCGRLSRTPSENAAAPTVGGRKYSGSKRSFDFGSGNGEDEVGNCDNKDKDGGGNDDDGRRRCRRQRDQRRSRSSSSGRRRTPSRERQPRSSSSDRVSGASGGGVGSGRRVSRSPGRRSDEPSEKPTGSSLKPGNAVFVPNSVSTWTTDKSSHGGGEAGAGAVRRVLVRRNGGGEARSQSPANRGNSNNNNNSHHQQQPQPPPSLSRSSSRKAEQSPHRRNPLGEIDNNSKATAMAAHTKIQTRAKDGKQVKPNAENSVEEFEPQALGRARQSRDLDPDLEVEALSNTTTAYNARLLEDIQSFHQKSGAAQFSVPPSLTKARSILDAVADLNSSTAAKPFSGEGAGGNRRAADSEAFCEWESAAAAAEDLTAPSFHRYVTTKRGTMNSEEMEEQESTGSNSFVNSSHLRDSGDPPKESWFSSDQRRLGGKKGDSDQQQSSNRVGRVKAGPALT